MLTNFCCTLAVTIVSNYAELAGTDLPDRSFSLVGVVNCSANHFGGTVAIENEQDAITFANETENPFVPIRAGDVIRASGRTAIGGNTIIRRNCTSIEILGHTNAPAPRLTTVRDLADGKFDNRSVKVQATLRDVVSDEIDPRSFFLILQDGADSILCLPSFCNTNLTSFSSLIGARVEATGLCTYFSCGTRTLGGRMISIHDSLGFTVIEPPPQDEFDVPGIRELHPLDPSRIAQQGRCRATGTVIAVWGRRNLLIMDNRRQIVGVELADENPPPYRTMVHVAGLPASNFYRINLLRAQWRHALGNPLLPDRAEPVLIKNLLTDAQNRRCFDPRWHGRAIQIGGTVKAMTTGEHTDGRFYVESDSFVIPVDASAGPSALSAIKVGYGLQLSGICIMEGENWSPYSAFPQIRGMTLVVRTPDDIRIVSKPSWWTAGRLLAAIGALLAVLGGILFWNFLLRAAVRKRENALKREIFARVNSDMKMRERQNLSIELHDSLSQGLTGVSMEIDTAKRLTDSPDELNRHLGLAASSLKACRDELRTCIYDLRNNALGDCDMNESIRRTLAPFVGNVDLQIRFNVPRERLTDTVAHNLLRIVRELVVNAVNHGRATTIKVAGALEGSLLNFSVRDNGCGFDPNACPGMTQGHFGIQGIRERLKRLNGSLSYDSSPNTGTKAVVTIDMPEDEDEEVA